MNPASPADAPVDAPVADPSTPDGRRRPDTVSITFRVDRDVHAQLKALAADSGTTLQTVMAALAEALARRANP